MAFKMASTPPAPTMAVQLGGLRRAMDPSAAQPCSATVGCLAWVAIAATMSKRPPASTIEVLTSSFPAIALRSVHTCFAMFWNFKKITINFQLLIIPYYRKLMLQEINVNFKNLH